MWQRAQLFYRLEVAENMRAYIAHNMDNSEDFCTRLELAESKAAIAGKLVEKGIELLRKMEEVNEVAEAEAHQLAEEKKAMEVGKKNVEKEVGQLRQKLHEGFLVQKEELKVEYQKRVDDMFFYGYQYCMKKHGINQD